jgi:hypothetical protein
VFLLRPGCFTPSTLEPVCMFLFLPGFELLHYSGPDEVNQEEILGGNEAGF